MLLDCAAADYWRSLYLATLGALVVFRVLAEGPFGVFTADAGRRPNALLIAGGIGITPIRALMEDMQRSAVVIYRVLREEDIVLGGELDAMAREHGLRLHYVVGDHRTAEGREHLSPAHLRELVPDIAERDVYVCGPPGLTDVLERNVRAAGVPKPFIHAERFAF